jgi:hypothetical protein
MSKINKSVKSKPVTVYSSNMCDECIWKDQCNFQCLGEKK